jgi:UPF0755 protein
MVKKIAGIVVVILCLAALCAGGAAYLYRAQLIAFAGLARSSEKTTKTYVLARGTSPRAVAMQLEELGIVADGKSFYRWMHFVAKNDGTLKAGTYELSPSLTPEQVVAELQTGRQVEVKVTIPEGLRKEEVAAILADAGFGSKSAIVDAMNDLSLVEAFGVPAQGADGQAGVPGGVEGYLFPDTYQFPRGTDPVTILRRMRARLDEVLTDRLKRRMTALGWNLHKTLTLAAIVEKETGARDERPHISSVFHNRMKRGMKLQTDPTVIYGIPNYDGNIRKSDLLREHRYNTYVIAGLPPGPIAQPGRAAIEAALFPSNDDDVFFVAMGDSGRHQFCPTLDCHNAAVQKWQIEFFARKRAGTHGSSGHNGVTHDDETGSAQKDESMRTDASP